MACNLGEYRADNNDVADWLLIGLAERSVWGQSLCSHSACDWRSLGDLVVSRPAGVISCSNSLLSRVSAARAAIHCSHWLGGCRRRAAHTAVPTCWRQANSSSTLAASRVSLPSIRSQSDPGQARVRLRAIARLASPYSGHARSRYLPAPGLRTRDTSYPPCCSCAMGAVRARCCRADESPGKRLPRPARSRAVVLLVRCTVCLVIAAKRGRALWPARQSSAP